jgi:hypothetical protein
MTTLTTTWLTGVDRRRSVGRGASWALREGFGVKRVFSRKLASGAKWPRRAFCRGWASVRAERRRGCVGCWLGEASALLVDPMGFDAGDSNLYRYVNNAPTDATDPSGMKPGNPNGPGYLDDDTLSGLNNVGADRARALAKYYRAKAQELTVPAIKAKFNSAPNALQFFKDTEAKVGPITIELFNKSPEMAFTGFYDLTKRVIYVRSDLSLDSAVGTVLYESIRAYYTDEQLKIYKDAAAGKLGRNEFARKQEELSFKYVQKHHEIAAIAVEKNQWGSESDKHAGAASLGLEGALKAFDTPGKGQGVDDTHTGYFRKVWDATYKKAWEDAQKKMKKP